MSWGVSAYALQGVRRHSGMWLFADGEQRRWNGLQNTPNDIRLLTDLLVRTVRG